MKAFFAVTLLILAYFVLTPKSRPKGAGSGRSIASLATPIIVDDVVPQKADALVVLDSERSLKQQPKSLETSNESILKAELENARKALSPRTLQWSQQLPKPSNQHEDVFNFYLQIAYENDSDALLLIQERASDFLRLDNSFSSFISDNLNVIETGREQNVRNFIFEFSKAARPNESIESSLIDDISAFRQNPQSFSESDLAKLKKLIVSSPAISSSMKMELISNEF